MAVSYCRAPRRLEPRRRLVGSQSHVARLLEPARATIRTRALRAGTLQNSAFLERTSLAFVTLAVSSGGLGTGLGPPRAWASPWQLAKGGLRTPPAQPRCYKAGTRDSAGTAARAQRHEPAGPLRSRPRCLHHSRHPVNKIQPSASPARRDDQNPLPLVRRADGRELLPRAEASGVETSSCWKPKSCRPPAGTGNSQTPHPSASCRHTPELSIP
jgi:hypothetical protein